MPETVTWRILGTSLQKTSSDDRSDPTVASAHSRSSSQDWSSRSSSRTKTGSEASRVRNRSNWRRTSGLRRTSDEAAARWDGSRLPAHLFRGTGRRRISRLDVGSNRSLSNRDGGDFDSGRRRHGRHDRWARDHVGVSRLPYHNGHLGRGASLGNLLHGDRRRPSPLRWDAMRESRMYGKARSGAGHTSRRRLKCLPGCQVGQAVASLAEVKRKITVGTYEWKAETPTPRYLPAPGHDPPCLGGSLLDPGPRNRRRGPLRWQLRHRPRFGRPRGRSPRHCNGGLRVASLRCRRERQLPGSRRPGLAPRGHLSSSSRGVRSPLGLPSPLRPGPRRPDSGD
jgi:hypothetical protein